MTTPLDWTSDSTSPPDGKAWDLLVVGGGTAGIVAARTAAGFGASVLLVEKERTGGDCLWTGCVPSKTLLASAQAAAVARGSQTLGVDAADVAVDFTAVMRRIHQVITQIEPSDAPETLRSIGARVAHAHARFTRPGSVALDTGETVQFRHAVLATGAEPALPPLEGLDSVSPLTSNTIWDLRELPQHLVVLGGGSIGCELAQGFARLGSAVTVIEAADHLLPRDDDLAGALVLEALRSDGVEVRLSTRALNVTRAEDRIVVTTSHGAVHGDQILVAVGRQPRTDGLGLAEAGIDVTGTGHVVVDARLRTTNPRVWAAGDLTGHPQFTHVAGVHGSLAASNAVLGLRRKVDTSTIPRVTYTHPEVAAFGVPATDGHRVVDFSHHEVDRAIADGQTRGATRLVLDRRRRIVGATVVGARAGELLGELVVAARAGLKASQLASTMHAYPGYADAIWKPAILEIQAQLKAPTTVWATRKLVSWQRARHSRVRS